MAIDLAFVWAGLIAFAVLAYVVLDGFDLGVGILFPFMANEPAPRRRHEHGRPGLGRQRNLARPRRRRPDGRISARLRRRHASPLHADHVMLLALVFRGVSFEYRWRTKRWKRVWDWSFALGSLVATFAQGITLGALVQGIEVAGRAYAGGWWDWLTPFSVLTGIALIVGYALLGSTWLIMKTTGWVQQQAFAIAWVAAPATLLLIGIVSIWTPFLDPVYMQRWFSFPGILYSVPVPLLVLVAAASLFVGLNDRRDVQPFVSALVLFVLCFIGLGIGFYPYIVPPRSP